MSKPAALSLAIFGSVLLSVAAGAGEEPPVRGEGPALPYLRAVHAKVHPLWADNFLLLAASQLPKDHAINDPARRVELAIALTAKGALVDVKVAKSSGASEFDSSAMEVVRAAGSFGPAPEEVLSDDGKVHLRWAFARNDRRCSGLTVTHRELPLVDAIRALVARDRDALAIARLQATEDRDRAGATNVFARAWLDHNENSRGQPVVPVALANALAGDHRAIDRLRQTVAMAARSGDIPSGLASHPIPSCSLVKAAFAKAATDKPSEPSARASEVSDEQFLRDVESSGSTGRVLRLLDAGADGACLSLVVATAKNHAADKDDRLAAVRSLGKSDGPEVKAALKALAKEPDPEIAAQVILAETRPGAGKGAVFRLTPRLRDKSLAVRQKMLNRSAVS